MKRHVMLAISGVCLGFSAGALVFMSRSDGILQPSGADTQPEATQPAHSASAAREAAMSAALGTLRSGSDLRAFAELGEILTALDSSAIGDLLSQLERQGNTRLDQRVAWLMQWWMKRDPQAAARWIQPRLDRAAQDGAISFSNRAYTRLELLRAWLKADPKSAVEYARSHAGTGLGIAIMQELKPADIDLAEDSWFELLRTFPSSTAQRDTVTSALERWAAKDAAAAFAAAQSLPEGLARDKATGAVLSKWSGRDPIAALEHYESAALQDATVLSQILSNAIRKDRERVLECLENLAPGAFARTAPAVIATWAGKEPVNALAWALEHGVRLSESVYQEIEAIPQGLGRTTGGKMSYPSPLNTALRTNAATTIEWIRSLPTGNDRNRLISLTLATSSVSRDAALSLFPELPPEYAVGAASRVAGVFRGDPAAGRAWAESLPEGPVRFAAWRGVGSNSPELFDLPPGPDRDAMLYGRVFGYGMAPEVAPTLDLTLQIGDPVLRRNVLNQAMERYTDVRFDTGRGAEARAWMEQAKVPEEWKRPWRK